MKPSPEPANTLDLRQPPAAPPKPPKHWQWRAVRQRSLVIAGAAIAALALLAGSIWLVPKLLSPFPLAEQLGTNYPLYYPRHLPAGYTVDRHSFQKTNQVVIFNINAPGGKNIAVSEETIPAGINLTAPASPSGITLPNQTSFSTGAGPAYVSLWGARYVCSIVASDTWILLNVTGFTSKQTELVAQGFTR